MPRSSCFYFYLFIFLFFLAIHSADDAHLLRVFVLLPSVCHLWARDMLGIISSKIPTCVRGRQKRVRGIDLRGARIARGRGAAPARKSTPETKTRAHACTHSRTHVCVIFVGGKGVEGGEVGGGFFFIIIVGSGLAKIDWSNSSIPCLSLPKSSQLARHKEFFGPRAGLHRGIHRRTACCSS